tara:strand:- start:676 stop:993 length:318 start_codon:yes stop_codon:yes gene_type:complete
MLTLNSALRKTCNKLTSDNTFGIFTKVCDEGSDKATVYEVFLMISLIISGLIYFALMMGFWIRLIFYAFKAGPGEGFSAIFFYNLYNMFKMGTFIDAHNNTRSIL